MAPDLSVILVLGMHRSGTSLLSNVLHYLGADMADDTDHASVKNPGGFWERPDLVAFNDEVLEAIGRPISSPLHSAPFPSGWWRNKKVLAIKSRMRSHLEGVLADARGWWGFKDPRTCRLLPLWRELFDELGITPHYVWAIRSPGEAAASMAAKNPARPMSPEQAEVTWLAYNYDVLRYTLGSRPVIVEYGEWFSDPMAIGNRILRKLDLPGFATAAELADCLRRIVHPEFRNQVEGSGRVAASIPLAQTLFSELSEFARSDTADAERLGRYVAMLDVTFRVMMPFMDLLDELPALRMKAIDLGKAEEQIKALTAEAQLSAAKARTRRHSIEGQRVEIDALNVQLSTARRKEQLASAESDASRLELEEERRSVAALKAEVERLRADLSEAANRAASLERNAAIHESMSTKVAALQARSKIAEENLAQALARVTALEAERLTYIGAAAELTGLHSTVEKLEADLARASAKAASAEADRSANERLGAELSELRSVVKTLEADLAQASAKAASAEADRAAHERLAAELSELRSVMKTLEADFTQANQRAAAAESKLAAVRQRSAGELAALSSEMNVLRTQIASETERAAAMKSAADAERERAARLEARARRAAGERAEKERAATNRIARLEARLAEAAKRQEQLFTANAGYLARIMALKNNGWLNAMPLTRSTGTTLRFNGVPGLKGLLDVVDAGGIGGWACWPDRPTERVKLAFYDGERFLGACTADQLRNDLTKQGIGDGRSAFHLPLPKPLADGKPHKLDIRLAATAQSVLSRPILVTVQPPAAKEENAPEGKEDPSKQGGDRSPRPA